MLQLRIMGDDPAHVDRVLEVLLRLMADSDELQVGEPVRLRHRGGGGRVVVDVSAVRPGPIRVEAERVDDPPPGRQALPRRYGGR